MLLAKLMEIIPLSLKNNQFKIQTLLLKKLCKLVVIV